MSSAHRSSSISSTFDRLRIRSFRLLASRHNDHQKRMNQSPKRTWTRKIQVHPNNKTSPEAPQTDSDTTNLFYTNQQPYKRSSSLSKNRKPTKDLFHVQSTSNVVDTCDFCTAPFKNPQYPSPSTPCMIRRQHLPLPMTIPTRVIKYPKSFEKSIEQIETISID